MLDTLMNDDRIYTDTDMRFFSKELTKEMGCILNEYLYYFYYREQAVQNILKKYKNPIALFQGHYHAAKITQQDNILYVSTPALVSYPNAFRIINITNYRNKVVFDLQLKETNEKNIQKLAKLLVFSSSIYTGEEKDQSYTYTIKK